MKINDKYLICMIDLVFYMLFINMFKENFSPLSQNVYIRNFFYNNMYFKLLHYHIIINEGEVKEAYKNIFEFFATFSMLRHIKIYN
jgi:hypothetical protein